MRGSTREVRNISQERTERATNPPPSKEGKTVYEREAKQRKYKRSMEYKVKKRKCEQQTYRSVKKVKEKKENQTRENIK